MVSVATNLGVDRSQARIEMQRILDLEKELAHVGESFFLFIRENASHSKEKAFV